MDSSNSEIPKRSSSKVEELNDIVLEAANRGSTRTLLPLDMVQLRIANLQLHGRDRETKLLKGKLRELKNAGNGKNNNETKTPPELLLIKGVSGTGKTALVMHGLRDPAQKMGMAFAGGKFDLNSMTQPLSAFINAMNSLTTIVVADDHLQKIREEIKVEFEEDVMILLAQVMAGCKDLFAVEKASVTDGASRRKSRALRRRSKVEGKEAVMRLQYAIRRLLKVICSNLKGTVLFIDDLQWGDVTTLNLMRSISSDIEIPSLLLVGAYREDKVPSLHPLAIHIQEMREQKGVSITTVDVENLNLKDVNSLVADVLKMEDYANEVATLAATVHKKTAGNPFFILMFLRYLKENGLIRYNVNIGRWLWDDDAISSTMVMQNVTTVMIDKLKKLKPESQQVLMVASCLGSSFSTSVVASIVETLEAEEEADAKRGSFADCSDTSSLVSSFVGELEEEGIWEQDSKDIRRFSHAQIQSAAFELIPHDERNSFRGRVGKAMMKRLDPDVLEEFLFDAMSLQNCAMVTMDEEERKASAKMNLRAGLKASKRAAFASAIVYFKAGREVLRHSWESDPATMLQLCSEEANARFIASDDLETMNELIEDVLKQPISVTDQFKVSMVKVKSLLAANNLHECIDTGLKFCRKLGLQVPNNKRVSTLVTQKEYLKTRHSIRNCTAEEIACLPEVSDESIVMGREILDSVLSACYQVQPTLFPIIVFLMTRSSIKHGISGTSCVAFSCFGMLLCGALGKLNEGREMARAAQLILANHDMKEMQPRVIFIVETWVSHWTAPIQASITPLLKGYQVGLEMGDIEVVGYCLEQRCGYLFHAARPLDSVQREIDACVDLLSQLNLKFQIRIMLPSRFTVMKLLGVDVVETCEDFETMLTAASKMSKTSTLRAGIYMAQLHLAVVFNNWGCAIQLLVEAGDLCKAYRGGYLKVRFTFYEALISLKAAQTSASIVRMKWKRRSLKSMKMLRNWAKLGNVNIVHMLHILSAELAALEGKWAKAKEGFESAVKAAARSGFLQDKALAHELAEAYFTAKGDGVRANYQHQKSQEAYADWGARAKVEGNAK